MSLKIEAGKYYRTRDGRRVGPMMPSEVESWPWIVEFGDGKCWHDDGREVAHSGSGDLIAEWRDDQSAHIITHNGREYDLTALEAPFGLLPEPVQAALKAWPHGVEMMTYSGKMIEYNFPDMTGKRGAVWRAKPAPVETRVKCYRSAAYIGTEHGTCIHRADGSVDWTTWEPHQ